MEKGAFSVPVGRGRISWIASQHRNSADRDLCFGCWSSLDDTHLTILSMSAEHLWVDAVNEIDLKSSNFRDSYDVRRSKSRFCSAYVILITGCDWPIGFPYSEASTITLSFSWMLSPTLQGMTNVKDFVQQLLNMPDYSLCTLLFVKSHRQSV